MISMLRLRQREPELERPFRVPSYPLFPLTALIIAVISILAMTFYNPGLALLFLLLMGISYGMFKLLKKFTSS